MEGNTAEKPRRVEKRRIEGRIDKMDKEDHFEVENVYRKALVVFGKH